MGEYSGEIKTKKENNKISVGSTTMTALNITKIWNSSFKPFEIFVSQVTTNREF